MDENDLNDNWRRYLEQESNRGLGDIPLRATAALAPFSLAQMDAATNLLDKSLRALDDGDEARARWFVERAVALPYDEHAEAHPGAMMAHQELFNAVTDALEDGGDDWLAAVTATFATAPEEARYSLRDALQAVIQDYELSDAEERRLHRLMSAVPEREELHDLNLPPEDMASAVLDVLEGVIIFVDAFEESVAFTQGEE